MCVYCNMGDHFFKYDPPWRPDSYPKWPDSVPTPIWPAPVNPWHPPATPDFPYPGTVPASPMPNPPLNPYQEWPLQRLKEIEEILKRIKALEDQLGCPCEPKEADYIGLFEKRIAYLEEQLAKKDK